MISDWLQECEKAMVLYEDKLDVFVNEDILEQKIRNYFEYSLQYISISDPFVFDVPRNVLQNQQSPVFNTFMGSNSSKPSKGDEKKSPNFVSGLISNQNIISADFNANKALLDPQQHVNQFNPLRQAVHLQGKSKSLDVEQATLPPIFSEEDVYGFNNLFTQKMAEVKDKQVEDNPDYKSLLDSARKSLDFLIKHSYDEDSSMHIDEKISEISKPVKRNYDSEIDDNFLSDEQDNYDITEYSSNESSNNVTYEYCYKDEEGNTIENDPKNSSRFFRFLEDQKESRPQNTYENRKNGLMFNFKNSENFSNNNARIERREDRKQQSSSKKFLYCNSKKIPKWAEDLDEVQRVCTEQKKRNLHLETFGKFKRVDNLNLECVFGVHNDGYSRRGDSVLWNTPESVENHVHRQKLSSIINANPNFLTHIY
jgi:hypothetical protein